MDNSNKVLTEEQGSRGWTTIEIEEAEIDNFEKEKLTRGFLEHVQ
jgi:hypothetical protein